MVMDEHVGSAAAAPATDKPSPFAVAVLLPWLVLVLYCAAAVAVIWRNPLQIGPDESMEFSKMLLVEKRPSEIPKVWNDQPWFYSMIFGTVFRITGFSPSIPRLFSVACTVLFCARLR